MEKKPIIIISAMEKTELNMLKNETNNIKTVTEGIYQFYETQIAGYPVVLCASKVGCINASSAITIGIRKYNPIAIINEGLAGSMTKKIHRHDLVIGQEVININSIKTPKRKAGEGLGACHIYGRRRRQI